MGIGTQGEPCAVMPQGAGQGFHVHAILQGQRCESMPEVMEPNVLRTNSLKNFLMGVPEGIRIEHSACLGRREHKRIPRMLLVLFHHQVHRLLGDWQDTDGVLGFWQAHHQLSLDAVYLLRDGDGSVLHVQVCPEEGEEFAPPQARGQFQIEGRQ